MSKELKRLDIVFNNGKVGCIARVHSGNICWYDVLLDGGIKVTADQNFVEFLRRPVGLERFLLWMRINFKIVQNRLFAEA